MLRDLGLKVAMPHRTFATVDHIVPTDQRVEPFSDPARAGDDGRAAQELRASSASPFSTARPASRASCTSSGRSRASRSPARPSPAATRTRARTARLARSRLASARRQVRDVLATQTMALGKLKVRRINVNGKLRPGRLREGRHPPHHPHARRERRHGLRLRIRRRGLRPLHDGRAHDRLQHVHRGRRARGLRESRRDDLRLSQGPALFAERRGVGCGRGALEGFRERRRSATTTTSSRSTPPTSRRP